MLAMGMAGRKMVYSSPPIEFGLAGHLIREFGGWARAARQDKAGRAWLDLCCRRRHQSANRPVDDNTVRETRSSLFPNKRCKKEEFRTTIL